MSYEKADRSMTTNFQTQKDPHRYSSSFEDQFKDTKLPVLKIKKVMMKIGSVEKDKGTFIPSDDDRMEFKKAKIAELRKQLYKKNAKNKFIPFENDLDVIVLDCWKYGETNGKKTVWKKYRRRLEDLTYDTMKVIKKKRLLI